MRSSRSFRVAVAVVIPMLVLSLAVAEEVPLERAPRIVVVDIDRALNSSTDYQQRLEALHDAETAPTKEMERDEIRRIVKAARTFDPGSPGFKEAEEISTADVAVMPRHWSEKQRATRLRQREGALKTEFFIRVANEVAAYAKENDIALVLNRSPQYQQGYEEFRELAYAKYPYLSKIVVFTTHPDITDIIIERMSQ